MLVVGPRAWPSRRPIVIRSTPACRKRDAAACRLFRARNGAAALGDRRAWRPVWAHWPQRYPHACPGRMQRTPNRISGRPERLRSSGCLASGSTSLAPSSSRSNAAVSCSDGQQCRLPPLPRSRAWPGRSGWRSQERRSGISRTRAPVLYFYIVSGRAWSRRPAAVERSGACSRACISLCSRYLTARLKGMARMDRHAPLPGPRTTCKWLPQAVMGTRSGQGRLSRCAFRISVSY